MPRIYQLIPILIFGAACSEDPDGGLHKKEVVLAVLETRLSASEVKAGESVQVECVAQYDDGTSKTLFAPDVTVQISPAEVGTTVIEQNLTIPRAGVYEVKCASILAASLKAATLTVKAAIAVRSIATLDRSSIASGEVATASCRVEDSDGNVVEDARPALATAPSDGVLISGFAITGVVASTYSITCALESVELVPAALTVTSGLPLTVEVLIADDTVFAGDRVDVMCLVSDAAGNAVMVETEYAVAPAVMMQDPAGFIPTLAGDYAITCSVPSAGLSSSPPTPLHVAAGLPASIVILEVVPTRSVYLLTEVIEVRARVADAFDNEVTTAVYEVTSNPDTSTRFAGPHRVELAVDGLIEVVARVTSPTLGGAEVSASVTLLIDGTPPEVSISFPARGEIIAGPSGGTVTIIGQATDPTSSVASLTINGAQVVLDAAGNFQHDMQPAWGIDLIEGTAVDLAGNSRTFAQSFEYATNYRQAGSNRITSGRIGEGLIAYLGQPVIDDDNLDVDDLATIALLAIEQQDIAALIPNPATNFHSDCSVLFVTITGDLRLHVDDVTFDRPIIDLDAIPGGVHVRAEIPNLNVALHTSGDVCDIGVGISGSASASRAIIEGDLLISRSLTNIVVSMPSASVALYDFELDLNLPSVIDWAVDGIISLFSGTISDYLEGALVDMIHDQVPPLVDRFLSGVSIGTQLSLPSPLNLTLGVDSRIGLVSFDWGRGDLGFDTTIYATGTITPEPLGGILQDARNYPGFSGTRAFAVGLAYDLINQALYSTWYGGGLELDLEQFIPGGVMSDSGMLDVQATASALLPPVLAPNSDPQYPIQLQLGDLRVDLVLDGVPNFPPINATIYASAYAPASAMMNGQGQLVIMMAPSPYVALDLSSSLPGVDVNGLITNLEQTVSGFLPQLFNQVVGGIPIPNIDLSNVAGNALPPGIVLGIGNATTVFHPAYLVLEGDIVQVP